MARILLAASVLLTAFGSAVHAGEVRIDGFGFGCRVPGGQVLKPQFGDMDGIFYPEIAGNEASCVMAVRSRIANCHQHTRFLSPSNNENYPECLPIFAAQARQCVSHFELQLSKCDGGRSAGRGSGPLSPDEWRRIQAALADRGFDPGPADGMPGPRTRGAVRAWQGAEGHAATGALTKAQARELLAARAKAARRPAASFGPGWIVADNRPCQLFSRQHELRGVVGSVTWSGGCVGGKASGRGTAVYRGVAGSDYGERRFEGVVEGGWPSSGTFAVRRPDGMARTCGFRNGRIDRETCTPWRKTAAAGARSAGKKADSTAAVRKSCRVSRNESGDHLVAVWSGPCADGLATGEGKAKGRSDYYSWAYRGRARNGRFHGPGRFEKTSINGESVEIEEGEFRESRLHNGTKLSHAVPMQNGVCSRDKYERGRVVDIQICN